MDLGIVVAQAHGDDLSDLSSSTTALAYKEGRDTYHNLHLGVMCSHGVDQLGESRNDIGSRLVLLHNVVRTKMHGDYVGRVLGQPTVKLILIGNIDGQVSRVALVVAIVLAVATVVLVPAGADEVDALPFGGLELFPQQSAPADDLRNGVAKWHVAQGGVLRCRRGDES